MAELIENFLSLRIVRHLSALLLIKSALDGYSSLPRRSALPRGDLHLTPLPPDPSKVRAEYNLLLTEKHWELGAKEGSVHEITGPAEWRIEGQQPQPHVTVDTAIRYVTDLRDKAANPVTKKNATRAIAALSAYKTASDN
jgi:hypothetical protein